MKSGKVNNDTLKHLASSLNMDKPKPKTILESFEAVNEK